MSTEKRGNIHSLEYALVDVFVKILRTYYLRINNNWRNYSFLRRQKNQGGGNLSFIHSSVIYWVLNKTLLGTSFCSPVLTRLLPSFSALHYLFQPPQPSLSDKRGCMQGEHPSHTQNRRMKQGRCLLPWLLKFGAIGASCFLLGQGSEDTSSISFPLL